jgi:hypothetical protein
MAVTGVNIDHMQDQEDAGGGGSNFKIPANSERIIYLCQPHENMGGIPFVKRLYHQRDLPDGSNAQFSVRCQRDDTRDDLSHCWACRRMAAARRKKLVENDAYDKLASKYSPRKKPIAQLIDITPLFDTKGQVQLVAGLKSCFLQYNQVEGCADCFLKDTCQRGVQRWYMPWKTYQAFTGTHFPFNGDITKGLTTTYTSQALPHAAMAFEAEVTARIQAAIQDLTPVDPKPTGTQEELDKIYRDFFELRDVAIESDGESIDDEANRVAGATTAAPAAKPAAPPPPAKPAARPAGAPAPRPAGPAAPAKPAAPAAPAAKPAAPKPPATAAKPAAPAAPVAKPAVAAPARTPQAAPPKAAVAAPARTPQAAPPKAAAPARAPVPAGAAPARAPAPAGTAPAKPAAPKPPAGAKPAAPAAAAPKAAPPKPVGLPPAKPVAGTKPAGPAAADPGLRERLAAQARAGKMDKKPAPPAAG